MKYFAVDGDFGAGQDFEDIAALDQLDGDTAFADHFFVITKFNQGGFGRLETEQPSQSFRRFTLGDALHPTAETDKDEEHGRRIEKGHRTRRLESCHRSDQNGHAVHVRYAGGQNYQDVHVGRSMAKSYREKNYDNHRGLFLEVSGNFIS